MRLLIRNLNVAVEAPQAPMVAFEPSSPVSVLPLPDPVANPSSLTSVRKGDWLNEIDRDISSLFERNYNEIYITRLKRSGLIGR
jgi:hypothetical protein